MAKYQPGESGNPAGRPKGIPNKMTTTVRQALTDAFEELGGVPALVTWAKKEPAQFYGLWVRVLPREVSVTSGLADQLIERLEKGRARLLEANS